VGRPRSIADDRLLAAAAAAIGRHGPGFTLADVAGEAGVAAGTLVARFGSKRGLLIAVSRGGGARTVADMRAAAARRPAGGAAVRAALIAAAADLDDPATAANHLAQLGADLADPELRAAVLEGQRAMGAELRRLLRRAPDLPAAPSPARAAEALLAIWNGTLLAWSMDPRGAAAARVGRSVDILLAGWRDPAARRAPRPEETT
jgi:AcrR family transcriptional regulator